jgi:hypothetical protein
MMFLWGREWSRAELMQRVGALSQLGGISHFEYCDGKAKGVTALRVRTAAGLDFSVLPEKGMDIVEAAYKGMSLSWHSPAGVVHPAYYDCRDIQWLKTFPGGLVGTCGSTTAGSPSDDQGEQLGLHGAIANTPAEHVQWSEEWNDDELLLTVSGKVREARVFGPNLVMNRTVRTSLASRSIQLLDRFVNEGYAEVPLMQVYHLNFGFPLLTERSRIYAPSKKVTPRTEIAGQFIDSWSRFEAPTAGVAERVYYHEMLPNQNGNVLVVLVGDDSTRDFGVLLEYRAATLPRFIQWKMPGATHYALGLEPANCKVEGRSAERQAGSLQMLPPNASREFALEIRVLDGQQEVAQAIASVEQSR